MHKDYYNINKNVDKYFDMSHEASMEFKKTEEFHIIHKYLKKWDSLCELWCGEGSKIASFEKEKLILTGIDISETAINKAKKQGFDYDVFCAVEDDDDMEKVYLLNPTEITKVRSYEVEKIIKQQYGNFIETAFDTKYCFMNFSNNAILNLLHQCYKIQSCNTLKNEYSKLNNVEYNIVFRLRFDIFFFNKINFNSLLSDVSNNKIICNNWSSRKILSLLPIQDFFFIWNNENMDILSRCFNDFADIFRRNEIRYLFKPIYYLFNAINKFNVKLWYRINKLSHALGILNAYLFFKVYTAESCFYRHLKNNNINIKTTEISLIFIRKNIEKSFVFLKEKSSYEI